jgi:hypothetical protein
MAQPEILIEKRAQGRKEKNMIEPRPHILPRLSARAEGELLL